MHPTTTFSPAPRQTAHVRHHKVRRLPFARPALLSGPTVTS
jgi:hypothetical protein